MNKNNKTQTFHNSVTAFACKTAFIVLNCLKSEMNIWNKSFGSFLFVFFFSFEMK